MVDLKTDIANLKGKYAGTSKSNKERISDALGKVPLLHQKGKVTEIPKPKTQEDIINDILKNIN